MSTDDSPVDRTGQVPHAPGDDADLDALRSAVSQLPDEIWLRNWDSVGTLDGGVVCWGAASAEAVARLRFIAAANPATIRRLLQRLSRLEQMPREPANASSASASEAAGALQAANAWDVPSARSDAHQAHVYSSPAQFDLLGGDMLIAHRCPPTRFDGAGEAASRPP